MVFLDLEISAVFSFGALLKGTNEGELEEEEEKQGQIPSPKKP